jgi:hypothetical protein
MEDPKTDAHGHEKMATSIDMIEKTSLPEDEALADWTAHDESVIRQKLDFRLVPIVFLLYLLCFIDR